MSRYGKFRIAVAAVSVLACCNVHAAKVCEFSAQDLAASAAVRIARIACDEHALWRRPFINAQGRIVRLGPMEAERDALADGVTPAWRRVAWYWRESGLLDDNVDWERNRIAGMGDKGRNGASDCADDMQDRGQQDWGRKAACRAFLIDVPWSAVFVSYTMQRADIGGFVLSSSHFHYLRDAAHNPDSGPYRLTDPTKEKPEVGDLICYVREKNAVYGHAGLARYLQGPGKKLDSHCDIVVAADLDGDSKLYAIGGNVMQGVTMRKLKLNAEGRLTLPMKREADAGRAFDPRDESTENMNRQDWAALLKLNQTRIR